MKNMKIIGIVVIAVIALVIVGIQLGSAPSGNEPIRIGSILILSGEGSAWGIAEKNGIDMAVEKINSEGGINGRMLAVSHQDDRGTRKQRLAHLKASLTEAA